MKSTILSPLFTNILVCLFVNVVLFSIGCKKEEKEPEFTFETVTNPKTGKTWMDRNLGATRVANSSDDQEAIGYYFQWGRGADGHEVPGSGTTETLATSATPGHGLFIKASWGPSFHWMETPVDTLWQGANGTNNPCPAGFRLPTEAEVIQERNSWSTKDMAGAFNSPLKWAAGGSRLNDATMFRIGQRGDYWTSTVDGEFSIRFYFGSTNTENFGTYRSSGLCVRCIKD